jgi:DNA invertase Pin-like site-specific DNA recombinase
MKTVTKLVSASPALPAKQRVAAYARVSSGKDAMLHSLSAQVSYYNATIQKRPDWQFAGIYADEALSGTKQARPEFQKLLTDCRAGQIDLVLTKSIARFARNTVVMLKTVRELKGLGIDVYFEKENIHSISGDGELMLTILASYAQEESYSVSENCKWRIRDKFKQGIPNTGNMLGYRLSGSTLQVVPEEAKIVQMIFANYLSGMGKLAIARKLNDAGLKTKNGNTFHSNSISKILCNEKYIGDMLLQKTYRTDHLHRNKHINQGQLPMYLIENSHEAIIDRTTFKRVQQEMKIWAAKFQAKPSAPQQYPFSGFIVCGQCGKNYRRKIASAGSKYQKPVWICQTFNTSGKSACPSQQIPENILMDVTAQVLGVDTFEEEVLKARIDRIEIPESNQITYLFKDGNIVTAPWQYPSRKSSWTDEMRRTARERQNKMNQQRREK